MMRKAALCLLLILSAMSSSLFAKDKIKNSVYQWNECVENIESYVSDGGIFMDQCNIHDRDIPQILSYLKEHPEITRLSLSDNQIGFQGAELLSTNTYIRYLFLNGNRIGSLGAEALAKNSSLVYLLLGENHIGPYGAEALANNTTLFFFLLMITP